MALNVEQRKEFAFMAVLGTQQITYEDPKSKEITKINCLVISILERSQKIDGHNFSDYNFTAVEIENGVAKKIAVHYSIANIIEKEKITHVIERLDGDKFKILSDPIIASMSEGQYKEVADRVSQLRNSSACCVLL